METVILNLGTQVWWLKAVSNAMFIYFFVKNGFHFFHQHKHLAVMHQGKNLKEKLRCMLLPSAKLCNLPRYNHRLSLLLRQSRLFSGWGHFDFIAYQLTYAVLFGLSGFLLFHIALNLNLILSFVLIGLAFFVPYLNLKDAAKRRADRCVRDLPFYLDYLILAMEAGCDLKSGIHALIQESPPGPLQDEFSYVYQSLQLGKSSEEALTQFKEAMQRPEISQFVQMMLQTIKMGNDVCQTLSSISAALIEKRFQIAEEEAGKISVKLMIPMLCFVMPAAGLIFLGPIMIDWLRSMG